MRGNFVVLLLCIACQQTPEQTRESKNVSTFDELRRPSLVILGTTQDAGSPHIGCEKICCRNITENRMVVSLGLVDTYNRMSFLIDATPDITSQLRDLARIAPYDNRKTSDGILLTHAHVGHYTGLMYFGKEALNADSVPVYAMPRMKSFLEANGPWSQLVNQGNIALHQIEAAENVKLTDVLTVTPLPVPHRDEFSETVGYRIKGARNTVLFIPDIDKWEKWDMDIVGLIAEVDYALLDGTFFHGNEIGYRDISQIPHPFIVESLSLFGELAPEERRKIHFIHFNHTNPVLNPASEARQLVIDQGFRVAETGMIFEL